MDLSRVTARLQTFFAGEPAVKFAYLFGSAARDQAAPLSDLDLAIYLDRRRDPFRCRLQLMESIAKVLASEKFDLIVLNQAPLPLAYEVIRDGLLLKDDRRRRVAFEADLIGRYLDTVPLRQVQNKYMKDQLAKGDYFG